MLRAVIFDVGGVLIRSRSREGREKWAARLGIDSWAFEELVFSGASGRQAQLGQKRSESHWQGLGDQLGLTKAELSEMRRDFFAGDVLDESLLAYVDRLRSAGFLTGLLSNAPDNARWVLTETYPVLDHFDGVVISAEVGLMKPDPLIYHLAADSVGVKVDEAVLVDDFVENIKGAKKVGMRAIHFVDPDAVKQELSALTGVE